MRKWMTSIPGGNEGSKRSLHHISSIHPLTESEVYALVISVTENKVNECRFFSPESLYIASNGSVFVASTQNTNSYESLKSLMTMISSVSSLNGSKNLRNFLSSAQKESFSSLCSFAKKSFSLKDSPSNILAQLYVRSSSSHDENSKNNDEIEFSRLDTSSDSSESPKIPLPPPIFPSYLKSNNNKYNNNSHPPPLLPSSLSSNTQEFKRNPSRLYRLVRPLTQVSRSPLPATKRCVGPEMIVMKDVPPLSLDLTHRSFRKEGNSLTQVLIHMLNGQRFLSSVPTSLNVGEILDSVLSQSDIKESWLYSLATISDQNEILCLPNHEKLQRVFPLSGGGSGIKERKGGIKNPEPFHLYQRFRFFVDTLDSFVDGNTKHQFYLQGRRDLLDGRLVVSSNTALSLGAMALQVEFGDYNDEIHRGDYFILDHYLPHYVILQFGRMDATKALAQLHKSRVAQNQSKIEVGFCTEIQKLPRYGFHCFELAMDKKDSLKLTKVGIHKHGIFLFKGSAPFASYTWNKIARIQYDKSRFQISLRDASLKLKFYTTEIKARCLFELSAAHHHSQRKDFSDVDVSYREPLGSMRHFKNKILGKRQLSNAKLITKSPCSTPKRTLKRSLTTAATTNIGSSSLSSSSSSKTQNTLIKRLTHYSSMIDSPENKENIVAREGNYRYKVCLEPDEDDIKCSFKAPSLNVTPLNPRKISSIPRKSGSGRRSLGTVINGGGAGMRMGTLISMSALHREKIRTFIETSDSSSIRTKKYFDAMEVKSLSVANNVYEKATDESLSESLLDRFDHLESEEPERTIEAVVVAKDSQGRLGLKITGTPSGIYIEDFNYSNISIVTGELRPGARIVAINGRSLENVTYANALDLIRKSDTHVQFLVSQLLSK